MDKLQNMNLKPELCPLSCSLTVSGLSLFYVLTDMKVFRLKINQKMSQLGFVSTMLDC